MNLLEYVDATTTGPAAPPEEVFTPAWSKEDKKKARGYLPSNDLIDAANVALLLNQPLLLTGEPGTGKTQFAYYLSWKLKLDPPEIFETKSTSTARDLFYIYDMLGRFRDPRFKGEDQSPQPHIAVAREYITYNALGIAILRANDRKDVEKWLPKDSEDVFKHGDQRRSVVLIDEVDKAPRDFPNDILNEIENMYFKIPELGVTGSRKITVPEDDKRPIIVLTSNSEKHLPDAFLRRCIYYYIPFPKGDGLTKIVMSRRGDVPGMDAWLADALKLFSDLRALDTRLDKKPATAELLNWLTALHEMRERKGSTQPLRRQGDIVWSTLSTTLLKSTSDQKLGKTVFEKWLTTK